jgi:hypothetical protein
MRRLILCTLGIWVLFVLVLSASVIIGRQQPNSRRSAILHLLDCDVGCWLGIVPGRTTINEANQKLKEVFGDSPEYSLIVIGDSPISMVIQRRSGTASMTAISPIWISVRAVSNTDFVDTIQLNFTGGGVSGQPTIGEIYTLLGAPQRVIVDTTNPLTFFLDYEDSTLHMLVVTHPQERIDPSQAISGMVWYSDATQMPVNISEFRPWYGFAPLQRYTSREPGKLP